MGTIKNSVFVILTTVFGFVGAVNAQSIPGVVETPVWGQGNGYSNASPGLGTGAFAGSTYGGAWNGETLVNPEITNQGGSYFNSVTTSGGGDTGNPMEIVGTNPIGNAFGSSNAFIGVGPEGTLPLVFIEGKSTSSGSVEAPAGYDPMKNFSNAGSSYEGSYTKDDQGSPVINIGVGGATNTAVTGGGTSSAYSNVTNYFQTAPMGTPNPTTTP